MKRHLVTEKCKQENSFSHNGQLSFLLLIHLVVLFRLSLLAFSFNLRFDVCRSETAVCTLCCVFVKCPGYMKQCNSGRTVQLLSINVKEVFVAADAREWFFSNMGPFKYFSQNQPFSSNTYKKTPILQCFINITFCCISSNCMAFSPVWIHSKINT